MRASVDRVRDLAIDAIEGVRDHAEDAVDAGAKRLVAGVDDLADQVPAVSVELERSPRSRRWLPVLLLGLGVAAFVVLRRLRAAGTADRPAPSLDDERARDETPSGAPDLVDLTVDELHVVPNDAEGWDIVGASSPEVRGHHHTQSGAIEKATELVGGGGGDIVIHGLDGKPRETRTVTLASTRS